ncbi:hypothetical protein BTS2_1394 [Bacillus sp. TS-2]|nr:hypothetical protein BTS2_1394 [Bacillus sp. TS-2]
MDIKDKRESFNRSFESLEEFVDVISEQLQCPVTIEDANHDLLAYSTHDKQTDEARISTIIGRRVPEKVINRLWKEGIIPKLHQSEEPLIISSISDIGLGNRAAIAIRKNQEVLGYIWLLEGEQKLNQASVDLLKIVAEKAKNQLLKKNIQRKKKEQNHQEFLWQLITGHLEDHREITSKLYRLSLPTSKPLAILLFSFNNLDSELSKKLLYVAKTTQKLQSLIQTIDDNQLIVLVATENQGSSNSILSTFVQTFKQQISERFSMKNVVTGIGYAYDDFKLIKNSYEEALRVVQLKKLYRDELMNSEFMHELGVFKYIDILKRAEAIHGVEKSAVIEQLKDYDQKNQTNLVETLEVILNKDGNVNEAAKKLHCHVNTLNYRIKRIQEITGISLKDPVQKLGLYLDLKLLNKSNEL